METMIKIKKSKKSKVVVPELKVRNPDKPKVEKVVKKHNLTRRY